MQPNARVSRKDVATLAGVAPSTVSLILNHHPASREIPEATRKRVTAAAEELGYWPNSVARALLSGTNRTIGVVLHFLGTPFRRYGGFVMEGAWQALRPHGYRMLLDEGSGEHEAGGLFRDKCTDGLLILAPPSRAPVGEFAAILKARFPAVSVGSSLPGDPLDYADLDNVDAVRRTTAHLLAAGHRRILHVSGPLATSSAARDRLKGYRQALRAAGLRPDERFVCPGDWLRPSGRDAVAKALDEGLQFTAVAAANDGMAGGAIDALGERGLRVPEDVSVTGVDAFGEELPAGIVLTTVAQPLVEVGAAAAGMLLERIRGKRGKPRKRLLRGALVPGNTVSSR